MIFCRKDTDIKGLMKFTLTLIIPIFVIALIVILVTRQAQAKSLNIDYKQYMKLDENGYEVYTSPENRTGCLPYSVLKYDAILTHAVDPGSDDKEADLSVNECKNQ